jgi:hypothetical protein
VIGSVVTIRKTITCLGTEKINKLYNAIR